MANISYHNCLCFGKHIKSPQVDKWCPLSPEGLLPALYEEVLGPGDAFFSFAVAWLSALCTLFLFLTRIELLVCDPCGAESLVTIFFLISAPLWKWQIADAAAQCTTLAPWCLCLGHLTQTIHWVDRLIWILCFSSHTSFQKLGVIQVRKVSFKISRNTSGKQSSPL